MKRPPDLQITFEIHDEDTLEKERHAVAHLSDEELLAAMVHASQEILLIADPVRLQAQLSPDAWEFEEFEVVPVNPDLQAFLLWHLAAEALGLAAFALEQRASATALGQVRMVCDAYCLLRWLKEPEAEDERKARTFGLVLSEIDDDKKITASLARTPEQQAERQRQVEFLTALQTDLEEALREDGIDPERPPATAFDLYSHYFPPGYRVYRLLSDIGGHVGFRFLIEFFRESRSSTSYRLDFTSGGLRQRAWWLGVGYFTFAALAEVVAWYLGWEKGMRREVIDQFHRRRGLVAEAQRRYDEHWLRSAENGSQNGP